jgi:acetyl-CoA carboxylase biotin carboxylase subunit
VKRLLIANRGEIALRIVRVARSLGVETVLAASSADADSQAAREATRTVIIGPPPARRSYLDVNLIVHAAKTTGCDALHPGYGFLSERAELAALCAAEDISFVGPTADSIERVGMKISARELAESVGVPVVPGSGRINSPAEAVQFAESAGYPVVTKAAAGGGGRGMIVARNSATLPDLFEKASMVARETFGDGTVFLEKFIENARHVEVQVFGDGGGRVLHFGERDCSTQRRYQKMIEEAPAVALGEDVRQDLQRSACAILSAIRYRSAGTVEFLYDVERQRVYFIEVNARIQVEHPVSEMIYGVDLIRLQLEIAAGTPLRWTQRQILPRGHAIEARIIAEDPEQEFMPSPGRITHWTVPEGPSVRLDTAVAAGTLITPYYDSMIAKLIVWGDTRDAAVKQLAAALEQFQIEGIRTNLPLLRFIVAHPDFAENRITTSWLERVLLPAYARRTEA